MKMPHNANMRQHRFFINVPDKQSNVQTSWRAVALCPVTSRHMMMCSRRITWKEERMGLESSTGRQKKRNKSVKRKCTEHIQTGRSLRSLLGTLTLQFLQLHESFVRVFLCFLQIPSLHGMHDCHLKQKKFSSLRVSFKSKISPNSAEFSSSTPENPSKHNLPTHPIDTSMSMSCVCLYSC